MGNIPLKLHGNRCPREAEVHKIHLRNDFIKRYSNWKTNAKSRIEGWRVTVNLAWIERVLSGPRERTPQSMPWMRRLTSWSMERSFMPRDFSPAMYSGVTP